MENPPDPYEKEVTKAYQRIMRSLSQLPRADRQQIKAAFVYAKQAHEGVRRKSGEPYILHPLEVARIVVQEMGLEDTTSVVCALLHDVVEDTDTELSDIKRMFGTKAMEIIDGLTKISGTSVMEKMDSKQAENFRKILLTISSDIRVVLIKLGDRLHNMRTLGAMRQESMLRNTSEVLYIYAPLAHRLGLYEIKTELENLSFKHSEPKVYQELATKLELEQTEAQGYIDKFLKAVRKQLKKGDLDFSVKSRFKSIYSIYAKMQRKELPFEEIYDKYAIRIILEARPGKEREDCWQVYSAVSERFQPNPKRLRDWITVPKDNGYESLHTTVLGPENRWVEVQIRTTRMDEIAEKGIAAHWQYKENGEVNDESLTKWIGQIRDILRNPSLNALEAVREFRENLQPNDVFVFSPKGEMFRLPRDPTVLDFAYKIHSEMGNSAIGAKVNNKVVTLDAILKAGDQVEILTSRKAHPTPDWLRFVKTTRAKDQIRSWLRKERKEKIEQGRRLFAWRAQQYEVDESHPYMRELLAYYMMPSVDDFFFALGSHQIDTTRIPEFIQLKKEGKGLDDNYIKKWEQRQRIIESRLEEFGVNPDQLVLGKEQDPGSYVLPKCCNPLPGDEILAFQEPTRIVIHRTSCQKAIGLMSSFSKNIIRARWTDDQTHVTFLTGLRVVGLDKQGMLNDLIRIISLRMKLNIRKLSIESHEGMFEGLFQIYLQNTQQLNKLIKMMEALPNIYTVSRYDGDHEGPDIIDKD